MFVWFFKNAYPSSLGSSNGRSGVAQSDRMCYVGVDDKGDERNCG